jgi:hypothetical protein
MGAFAKLLNGFGTPTTYIVITYYNVKKKDLNLLDKFPHGMPVSCPGPARLHYTGFRNKRLRTKVFQLQDPDPWQQLRAARFRWN